MSYYVESSFKMSERSLHLTESSNPESVNRCLALKLIENGDLEEFDYFVGRANLNPESMIAVFKELVDKRSEHVCEFLKTWEKLEQDHIYQLRFLPIKYFALFWEYYTPSPSELINALKSNLTKERLVILIKSKWNELFFKEVVNKRDVAEIVLNARLPLDFYMKLFFKGFESRWFNIPFRDSTTLMHLLIREGEATFMKHLLEEIPESEIYLGDFFSLEDFKECQANSLNSPYILQLYSLAIQRGCTAIVQEPNGSLQFFSGRNVRELPVFQESSDLENSLKSGSLKIYMNRNHFSIGLRFPNQSERRHFGFYPVEDVAFFAQDYQCGVLNDIKNAEESDRTNELTLDFLIDAEKAEAVKNYVESVSKNCKSGNKKYNAALSNCVHFAQGAAEIIGFSGHLGQTIASQQLIRRLAPLPNHHSHAAHYSLARSNGVVALALAHLSTTLAVHHASFVSVSGSPTLIDAIVGGVGCYLIYRVAKSCISTLYSYFYPTPPNPPSQEKLRAAESALKALEIKINTYKPFYFKPEENEDEESEQWLLSFEADPKEKWDELRDELYRLIKDFQKPRIQNSDEEISDIMKEISNLSNDVEKFLDSRELVYMNTP